MYSKRNLLVLSSAFLMALLALSMSAPLLPASPLSAPVSSAEEYVYTPTARTEYPWTYGHGHISKDGTYPGWDYTEGPGPLTDHILWKADEAVATVPQISFGSTDSRAMNVFDGRVHAYCSAFDAATGELIWTNPEIANWGGMRAASTIWNPNPDSMKLAWWSPYPTYNPMHVGKMDDGHGQGATGYIYANVYGPGKPDQYMIINAETGDMKLTGSGLGYSSFTKGPVWDATEYFFDFDLMILAQHYVRGFTASSQEGVTCICCDPLYSPLPCMGWYKLWTGFQISTSYEYPIAPMGFAKGGSLFAPAFITAPGALAFERPPEDVIMGLRPPENESQLNFLRRYWCRYERNGCSADVVTSKYGLMFMSGPSHGLSTFYNETTGQIVSLTGGTGAAFKMAPWQIPDGKALGLYELLNLDGNASQLSTDEWIQCDWDWTTTGGRDTDSMSWLYALNMTDGTMVWRRVGHMGCQGIIVDDEHQRIYDSTPGGYIKAYDLITGEKVWWWNNPYALNDTTNSFRTLANWASFDGENLYASAWNGHMYKINGETGETMWDTFTEGFGGCGAYPLYSKGSNMVYMGQMSSRGWRTTTTDPGQVIALDADTGEIVWKYAPIWVSSGDHVVADGRLYITDYVNKDLICFGAGPTETTIELSSEQLKAGDTVLISGQLLDKSPPSSGNYDAPCADCSVTLMYCPLGGAECNTIATVNTGYAGDYYYEWTVPSNMTGMYSVIASYAGDNPSYLESSGTINFRVGEAGLSQAEMEQVGAAVPDYSMMFYAVIAVVIITLALVVYSLFVRKK